jgi:hypothetical protein
MGIVANRNFETYGFLTAGNYPSAGGWLQAHNTQYGRMVYYDRLDMCLADWALSGAMPASESWIRFDPLWLSNTGTLFDAVAEPGTIGGVVNQYIHMGHWDKAGNEQKVYTSGSANGPFNEVLPLALNNAQVLDVWPNVGVVASRNGLVATDPFYYTNTQSSQWLFFETWGYGIITHATVYDAGGVQKIGVMAQVDLATGNATILDTPVSYGTAAHEFSEAPLFGQDVNFELIQFLPDDDDEPARPKGQMYLWSPMTNHPVTPSTHFRGWFKIIDWNPTAKSGTPSRTHLQERLLTATDLQKATPGATDGVHESGTGITYEWIYHPRSNLLFILSSTVNGPALAANNQKVIFFSPTPGYNMITEPSATGIIASGKTVPWSVTALGTLYEPIINVNVQYSIQNESTVGEVLATTPTPGETVTLANTVKPTDAVVSPISVYEDGVKLTETTHYTLNRGASQITFVAPKPLAGGEVYTADYRHWDDPQSSPHGVLLSEFATSDVDGVATTRVRYAEENPVKDRWDRITATKI